MIINVTTEELRVFIREKGDSPVNMVENEYNPEWSHFCGCLFVQYVMSKNGNIQDYSCCAGNNDCIIYDLDGNIIAEYRFECYFSHFGIAKTFSGFKV